MNRVFINTDFFNLNHSLVHHHSLPWFHHYVEHGLICIGVNRYKAHFYVRPISSIKGDITGFLYNVSEDREA